MRVMWSDRDPDARRSGKGNVFVKNLSESVDNIGLQALFGKFGTIVSCKVATFEDGKSKGHGFVQFDTDESVVSAIENLNGYLVHTNRYMSGSFSEFGKIVSLMIARAQNGTSREFGFVNFENPDDARLAMERLNETELGSKALYVGRAQKKQSVNRFCIICLRRYARNRL